MSWQIIAKKEYLENVRNAWILAVGGIFLLLTLVSSGFAAALRSFGGDGFEMASITTTISAMEGTTSFFLPILALMLGFGTISGERESGSLALLVAQPVSRLDILMGKAAGLWAVLASAILGGAGVGGLIVIAATGTQPRAFAVLLIFLLVTLAWGAAWIAITVFLSSFFQRRGTTIGGALFTWFFFSRPVWFVIGFAVLAMAVRNAGMSVFMGDAVQAPGWVVIVLLLNPNLVYDALLSSLVPELQTMVGAFGRNVVPDVFTPPLFALAMLAWIVLPLVAAYSRFRSRDI